MTRLDQLSDSRQQNGAITSTAWADQRGWSFTRPRAEPVASSSRLWSSIPPAEACSKLTCGKHKHIPSRGMQNWPALVGQCFNCSLIALVHLSDRSALWKIRCGSYTAVGNINTHLHDSSCLLVRSKVDLICKSNIGSP